MRGREPLLHRGLRRATRPSEPQAPTLFSVCQVTSLVAGVRGLAEIRHAVVGVAE